MKLKKVVKGDYTYYYAGDVLRYKRFKLFNGYQSWSEYDSQSNEIHYKSSTGFEWWSDNHPDNPKNKNPELVDEKDIGAFEFKSKKVA